MRQKGTQAALPGVSRNVRSAGCPGAAPWASKGGAGVEAKS